MNNANDYNYESAGFDGFLSRSIDGLNQVNLDSQGPVSTAIRYDAAQVSGMLGDTFKTGIVSITKQGIFIDDGNNNRVVIGDDGGF